MLAPFSSGISLMSRRSLVYPGLCVMLALAAIKVPACEYYPTGEPSEPSITQAAPAGPAHAPAPHL